MPGATVEAHSSGTSMKNIAISIGMVKTECYSRIFVKVLMRNIEPTVLLIVGASRTAMTA